MEGRQINIMLCSKLRLRGKRELSCAPRIPLWLDKPMLDGLNGKSNTGSDRLDRGGGSDQL